jgi:hypothetical protein
VRVVQVDVPGDAIVLHRRGVRGPAAAAHVCLCGGYAVTHGRSSLKRRERYKRGKGGGNGCDCKSKHGCCARCGF